MHFSSQDSVWDFTQLLPSVYKHRFLKWSFLIIHKNENLNVLYSFVHSGDFIVDKYGV